jgi:hypothetical protein
MHDKKYRTGNSGRKSTFPRKFNIFWSLERKVGTEGMRIGTASLVSDADQQPHR